jgi:hypothetical protein
MSVPAGAHRRMIGWWAQGFPQGSARWQCAIQASVPRGASQWTSCPVMAAIRS